MKSLFRWIIVASFLWNYFSIQATHKVIATEFDQNVKKSNVKVVGKTLEQQADDFEKGLVDISNQNYNDDNANLFLMNCFSSDQYTHLGANVELKDILLDLKNNSITNSGAISLAVALDYLKDLKELDIRQNPIGRLGLQTIFVKAFSCHKPLTLRFTTTMDIKNDLRNLEQEYKVSEQWSDPVAVSDTSYDFEVCFIEKYRAAFDFFKYPGSH